MYIAVMGTWADPREVARQRHDLDLGQYARKMRRNPSPIERPVKRALESLKLSFLTQHIIGNYIVDFFLPKYKLVVECDGFAYHQNTEREERRDRFLMERGFRVLHIPGWLCKQPTPLSGFIRDFISSGNSVPIRQSLDTVALDTVTSQAV